MSGKSNNGTQNTTNGKKANDLDKRRKSKPKIPKPVLSENKSKLFGTKKPWSKLKNMSADQKDGKTSSVRFEIKNGEGVLTDMQLESSDMQLEDFSDDQLNSRSGTPQVNKTTDSKTLNGKAGVPLVNTAVKEKSVLTLPRSGSLKKDRNQISDIEKIHEKKSLLSKRESTKTSLTSHASVDAQLQNNSTVIYPPEEHKPKSVLTNDESYIRSAIPYLPLGLSVLCLFLNFILPGSGTMISGLSILCCGKSRLPAKGDQRMITVCVNMFVGVAQLFTVTFLLVGWFWSLAWGFHMVSLSVEYKLQKKQQRERELQTLALSAFGNPVNVRPLFQHI